MRRHQITICGSYLSLEDAEARKKEDLHNCEQSAVELACRKHLPITQEWIFLD